MTKKRKLDGAWLLALHSWAILRIDCCSSLQLEQAFMRTIRALILSDGFSGAVAQRPRFMRTVVWSEVAGLQTVTLASMRGVGAGTMSHIETGYCSLTSGMNYKRPRESLDNCIPQTHAQTSVLCRGL